MNYSGCEGIVTVKGNAILELTGFTIEQSTDALDSTKMDGNCNRSVKAGKKSWSGTIDAFYDPDEIWNQDLENGVLVELQLYPEGVTSLSGNALINNVSIPVEIDGMVSQSFTFDGVGLLTIDGANTTGYLVDSTTGDFLVDSTTGDNLIES